MVEADHLGERRRGVERDVDECVFLLLRLVVGFIRRQPYRRVLAVQVFGAPRDSLEVRHICLGFVHCAVS